MWRSGTRRFLFRRMPDQQMILSDFTTVWRHVTCVVAPEWPPGHMPYAAFLRGIYIMMNVLQQPKPRLRYFYCLPPGSLHALKTSQSLIYRLVVKCSPIFNFPTAPSPTLNQYLTSSISNFQSIFDGCQYSTNFSINVHPSSAAFPTAGTCI